MADINAAIAAYEPLLEDLARPFVGRNGAELDDLVQEGRIDIWQALERGVAPSAEMMQNRMKDWVRHLDPHNPVPYDTLLPIEIPGESSAVDRFVAAQDE